MPGMFICANAGAAAPASATALAVTYELSFTGRSPKGGAIERRLPSRLLQLLAVMAAMPGLAFMLAAHVLAAVAAFHLLMLSGFTHPHVLGGHLVARTLGNGLSGGKRRGH